MAEIRVGSTSVNTKFGTEMEDLEARPFSKDFVKLFTPYLTSESNMAEQLRQLERDLKQIESADDPIKGNAELMAQVQALSELLNSKDYSEAVKAHAIKEMFEAYAAAKAGASNYLPDTLLLSLPVGIIKGEIELQPKQARREITEKLIRAAVDGLDSAAKSSRVRLSCSDKNEAIKQLMFEYGVSDRRGSSHTRSVPKRISQIKDKVRQALPLSSVRHLYTHNKAVVTAANGDKFGSDARGDINTPDGVHFYKLNSQDGLYHLVKAKDLKLNELKTHVCDFGPALGLQMIASINDLSDWGRFYENQLQVGVGEPHQQVFEHAMLMVLDSLVKEKKIELTEPYQWKDSIQTAPFLQVAVELSSSRFADRFTAKAAKKMQGSISSVSMAVELIICKPGLSRQIVAHRRKQILDWCLEQKGAGAALERITKQSHLAQLENELLTKELKGLAESFAKRVEQEIENANSVAKVTELYERGYLPDNLSAPAWTYLTNFFQDLAKKDYPVTLLDVQFWKEVVTDIEKQHKGSVRQGVKKIPQCMDAAIASQRRKAAENIKVVRSQPPFQDKLKDLKTQTNVKSFLTELAVLKSEQPSEFQKHIEQLKDIAKEIDARELLSAPKVKEIFVDFVQQCSIEELQVVSPFFIHYDLLKLGINRADELDGLDQSSYLLKGKNLLEWLPENMLRKCSVHTREVLLQHAVAAKVEKIEKFSDFQDIDTNVQDEHGNTPLMNAVLHGNISAAKFLMSRLASDLKLVNNKGQNLHHLILLHGNAELKQLWFNVQKPIPDINDVDKQEVSPLMIAVRQGDMEMIDALIVRGAKAETSVDKDILVQRAILSGNPEVLHKVVKHFQCNILSLDRNGNNYLHFAVAEGKPECLTFLLEAGVSSSLKNNVGRTPLETAVYRNTESCIIPLLTELDMGKVVASDGNPLLLYAIAHNHSVAARVLMDNTTFDETFVDRDGYNAAHLAAMNTDSDIMKLLYERGFNIDAVVGWGLPQNSITQSSPYVGKTFTEIVEGRYSGLESNAARSRYRKFLEDVVKIRDAQE
ncbi:hypothetical protein D5018_02690 [Parashewanella curva]|uniref:Uncharacterized protein n=1 Tax=Parashewanella curva TaxID=2338552 RepID=A0A3L8Q3E0_9GAMM|nr:ankyrin repeat domain-containing protein [Parashewanella curva]RLV61182.1 hypothetical protein D5018_02690 [Parashewanella curva]